MKKRLSIGLLLRAFLAGWFCIVEFFIPNADSFVLGAKASESSHAKSMASRRESEWETVTLSVNSTGISTLFFDQKERLQAIKSRYTAFIYFDVSVPVTAFVTARGHVWVGPEQDFYIDTACGVIGGRLWHGDILWCKTLIARRPNDSSDISKALSRFETEVSEAQLLESYIPYFPPHPVSRMTDLMHCLGFSFFGSMPDTTREWVQSAHVTWGTVRVHFTCRSGDSADAWIDIESKRLLKATLNGALVFERTDFTLYYFLAACLLALLATLWYRRHKRLSRISDTFPPP